MVTWEDVHHVGDATYDALLQGGSTTPVVTTTVKALLIYLFTLVLMRAGKSRMLGRASLFDIVLIFVLGSMLSRAVNGDADPIPTAIAGSALVLLHWLFGILSFHSHAVGRLVKGEAADLVRDGQVVDGALHAHHVSTRDLEEAMHKQGVDRVEDIKLARLERDGKISIVPKFRVVEVEVQEGVQRVRIEV